MLLTGFPCKAGPPWVGAYAGGSDGAGAWGAQARPPCQRRGRRLPCCLPACLGSRGGWAHVTAASSLLPPTDPSSGPPRPTLKPPPRHELPTSDTPTTKATALWSQTRLLARPLGTSPAQHQAACGPALEPGSHAGTVGARGGSRCAGLLPLHPSAGPVRAASSAHHSLSVTHSHAHSFTHSFIHSHTHSFIHLLIH